MKDYEIYNKIKGRDIIIVCKWGGWNSAKTFVETYVHIEPNLEVSKLL